MVCKGSISTGHFNGRCTVCNTTKSRAQVVIFIGDSGKFHFFQFVDTCGNANVAGEPVHSTVFTFFYCITKGDFIPFHLLDSFSAFAFGSSLIYINQHRIRSVAIFKGRSVSYQWFDGTSRLLIGLEGAVQGQHVCSLILAASTDGRHDLSSFVVDDSHRSLEVIYSIFFRFCIPGQGIVYNLLKLIHSFHIDGSVDLVAASVEIVFGVAVYLVIIFHISGIFFVSIEFMLEGKIVFVFHQILCSTFDGQRGFVAVELFLAVLFRNDNDFFCHGSITFRLSDIATFHHVV